MYLSIQNPQVILDLGSFLSFLSAPKLSSGGGGRGHAHLSYWQFTDSLSQAYFFQVMVQLAAWGSSQIVVP